MENRKIALVYDNGCTNLRAALVDNEGNVLAQDLVKVAGITTNEDLSKRAKDMGDKLIQTAGCNLDDIIGVGIASAGNFNEHGNIDLMPNSKIPEGVEITFPTDIEKHYKKPTVKINDCSAGARAAQVFGLGKGKNYGVIAYITMSTGVNSGYIIHGEVYRGEKGKNPESGHSLAIYNGRECGCGGKGHFEAYLSGSAIAGMAREKLEDQDGGYLAKSRIYQRSCKELGVDIKEREKILANIKAEHVYSALNEGDNDAEEINDTVTTVLAALLGQQITTFRPGMIELGGSIIVNNQKILSVALKKLNRNRDYSAFGQDNVAIGITPLGDDNILLGVAAEVFYKVKSVRK